MQVLFGPFHPHLEEALVREISRFKAADPFSPLLILVPSDPLRRRLKTLLALEHRQDLIHLHILTFHQLSLRLHEEQGGGGRLRLREDLFLEETVRSIVRSVYPEDSDFSRLVETQGGGAALWQTLRDLKDGGVVPDALADAVREGVLGPPEKTGTPAQLSRLYALLHACCEKLGILDFTDLDIRAAAQVPDSRFLKQFVRIFHYGFYDLTQVQIDLFQSIARHYPVTLLFPLIHKHPAWDFAQKFYDRYVLGLTDVSSIHDLTQDDPLPENLIHHRLFTEGPAEGLTPSVTVEQINCSGAQDEILTVAKEILRVHEEEGVPFDRMGVVARVLQPYATEIKAIFPAHGIPLSAALGEPLTYFPFVKAVSLLMRLRERDYLRPQVMDLFSAPFFRAASLCSRDTAPCPERWEMLTRRLGITRGRDQWQRLTQFLDPNHPSGNGKYTEQDQQQARCLWEVFAQLDQDLGQLPGEAAWPEYIRLWRTLFDKYLGLREGEDAGGEDAVRTAVLDTLDGLSGLEALSPRITRDVFTQTFQRWLERRVVPISERNVRGVAVMDVMAARGVPFSALFLLGMNEGAFPRQIREDALLRDSPRRKMDSDLGFKVGEKLAGYEEEKLLFTLLAGSVSKRLTCLYQRSDETGRALAPSWYLGELRRAVWGESAVLPTEADGSIPGTERRIPRGIVEKRSVEPFNRDTFLMPRELAVQWALQERDPLPILENFRLDPLNYQHGRSALDILESRNGLTPHDGLTGPLPDHWNEILRKGISPTSLEAYGRCPFQYYVREILRLERVKRPEEVVLGPLESGNLCHDILKACYQELIDQKYFTQQAHAIDPHSVLNEAASRVLTEYEQENPVGYPAAWEVVREQISDLISVVIDGDLAEMQKSGFYPVALEEKFQGQLDDLPLRGRIDRIDFQPEQGRYRVIDYKYKGGKTQEAMDKNLLQSAIRRRLLQLPLYLILARQLADRHGHPEAGQEAWLYFLAPRWQAELPVRGSFPGDAWEGQRGKALKSTVSEIVSGIRQGRFGIVPGKYCDYCDALPVCRKEHLDTRERSQELIRRYREIRDLKVSKS